LILKIAERRGVMLELHLKIVADARLQETPDRACSQCLAD
jgi:hypothetical protein